MPDEVRVAHPVVQQEHEGTQRVAQAARHQQRQSGDRQACDQRTGGQQHHPAHGQIEPGGHQAVPQPVQQLDRHAEGRRGPDDDQQRDARPGVQHTQREGGVAAGDEDIDGRMVHAQQPGLGAALGQRVIQRRDRVEQDHRRREHRCRHHVGHPAVAHRPRHEDGQGRDGEQRAQAVAEGIGDLFADRLGPVGGAVGGGHDGLELRTQRPEHASSA
mmetsp:Transcript_23909/g.56778  ORF Transcript_23909/g.56778 Transcript_23909/m.56778 type:complete len:216 (+) Transcript_23909:281-928(+)